MGRRHGGRGHQVSRQTVRLRRRAGIQPKRGHNFDSRLRNERAERLLSHEVKALTDKGALIERLISAFDFAPSIREDACQELWLLSLEHDLSERELRQAVPAIRTRLRRIAFGDWTDISLDQEVRSSHMSWVPTMADLIDQDGRFMGGPVPLAPDLRMGRPQTIAAHRAAVARAKADIAVPNIHAFAVALGRRGGLVSGPMQVARLAEMAQGAAHTRWRRVRAGDTADRMGRAIG